MKNQAQEINAHGNIIDTSKFIKKSFSQNCHITSSLIASYYLRELMKSDVEEFWVLALASSKKVIKAEMLFRGTVDACLVHPRDIFRFACVNNASSIIIAHNHPSGDHSPSSEDVLLTKRIVKIGELLKIPVVDHLILAEEGYFSFTDERLINGP